MAVQWNCLACDHIHWHMEVQDINAQAQELHVYYMLPAILTDCRKSTLVSITRLPYA